MDEGTRPDALTLVECEDAQARQPGEMDHPEAGQRAALGEIESLKARQRCKAGQARIGKRQKPEVEVAQLTHPTDGGQCVVRQASTPRQDQEPKVVQCCEMLQALIPHPGIEPEIEFLQR